MRKEALKQELLAVLAAALDAARAAHAAAIEGATHAEAKAENAKDTRGLEQSYLARGQAQRIGELAAAIADVAALELRRLAPDDPAGPGALVTVDEDEARHVFFLAPHGGGEVLAGGVQVVTPRSPLGAALLGKRAGDDAEVRLGKKTRELVVVEVE